MGIINDFRKLFESKTEENNKKHLNDAYEKKKKEILEQQQKLFDAFDELEEQAKKMDQVVKQFHKAKK